MNGWNPKDPEQWAARFGLVAVPMFGAHRDVPGVHALMLDGQVGSFVLSASGPSRLVDTAAPVGWAWSANVSHAVILAPDGKEAYVRRWDSPNNGKRWPVARDREAAALFDAIESAPPPPFDQSVIERGLQTFRTVRVAIEKKGGSDLDTVLAFNTVLAWVAQDKTGNADFEDAIRALRRADNDLGFTEHQLSKRIRSYPIGDLARLLREGNSKRTTYLLDADLLVRHASGPLYQEAHKQLLEPLRIDSQGELFPNEMLLVGREHARGPAPSFVHHTPPSLARALIEIALSQVDAGGDAITILDPASGSGVFLIEAVRELVAGKGPPANIVGFDKSSLAVAMSEFCVRHAAADVAKRSLRISIEQRDSVSEQPWGSPHIVAMNPPFVAWEDLDAGDRHKVRSVLAPFHRGRPDLGLAFLYRAIECIAPGGVVVSIVPPSLFESETAMALRSFLMQSQGLQLRLLGRFQDSRYFDASVEPSFVVITRSRERRPIRIVTASDGNADKAIRAIRSLPWDGSRVTDGYEIYDVTPGDLSSDRWTPQPQRNVTFVRALTANTFTRVADLFVPRLGIRTGNKGVFLVRERDLAQLAPKKSQAKFFRPVADRIENGQIQPAGYVFYPYDERGTLLLNTEGDVKDAVPEFYRERLKPNSQPLKDRSRYRQWWEPTRPLTTWLSERAPRIVSQQFGRAGNFAFDATGDYAVVQGVGWCWKDGRATKETLLAYLAILNSQVFERAIACFCQPKRGGQFELTQHFVERIPLPELADPELRQGLAAIGAAIWKGAGYEKEHQNVLAMRAYGLSSTGVPFDIPDNQGKRAERRLRELRMQWEQATGFYSRVDRKISHPLYRAIVALGPAVIPALLKEMRDDPGYWSPALSELTGEDPVPEDADTLAEVASAWVAWGKEHGYL